MTMPTITITAANYPIELADLNINAGDRTKKTHMASNFNGNTIKAIKKATLTERYTPEIQSVVLPHDHHLLYRTEEVVLHERDGACWVEFQSSNDRELMYRLIYSCFTQGDKHWRFSDSWWFDERDASDEMRWVNLAIFTDAGKTILKDMCDNFNSISRGMVLLLATLFPEHRPVEEIDDEVDEMLRMVTLSKEVRDGRRVTLKLKALGEKTGNVFDGCHVLLDTFGLAGNAKVFANANMLIGASTYCETRLQLNFDDYDFENINASKLSEVDRHARTLYKSFNATSAFVDFDGPAIFSPVDVADIEKRGEASAQRMNGIGAMMGNTDRQPVVHGYYRGQGIIDPVFLDQLAPDVFRSFLGEYSIGVSLRCKEEITQASDLKHMIDMTLFYGTTNKRWATGRLSDAKAVSWNHGLFDQVIMKPERKALIKAILTQPLDNLDLIQNKGNNAVFLFAGDAGCGKTLTAEASSHLLEQPLIKINFGELGVDVRDVENRMRHYLDCARRWGATVLIDEADVFLEQRDNTNLQRTALVACFLQLLEYFQGTMFLTTNRQDTIDPAIRSRITLNLNFSLADIDTHDIWTGVLSRTNDILVTPEGVDRLVALGLNGREIKLLIGTAVRLARSENRTATTDDLIAIHAIMNG